MSRSKVGTFHEDIDPFLRLFQSVEASVVTIQAEGEWRNIRTQCTLRADPPAALLPRRRPVDSAIVRTIHVALPIEELGSLLEGVTTGTWVANHTPVRYLQSHFRPNPTPYILSDEHFFNLHDQWRHPAFRWSGYVLHGAGDTCQEVIARVPGDWGALERVARRSLYAAGTIDRIASEFTGVEFSLGAYCTVFELYAPLAVRFATGGCRFDRTGIRFVLEAGSRPAAKACQLHANMLREGGVGEDARSITTFEWRQGDGLYRASGTLPNVYASNARIKLSLGPEVVDQVELTRKLPVATAGQNDGRRRVTRASTMSLTNDPIGGARSLPQVGTARTSAHGVAILSALVHRPQAAGGLGWIFRQQLEADVGVDGHIEIVGTATDPRAMSGRLLGVQIKAGASAFARGDESAWLVPLRRSTVNYWYELAVPVLVILVSLESENCYWTHVSSAPPPGTSKHVRIRVLRSNRLSSRACDALRALTETEL
jgi:hypothetical protein